MEKIDIIKDITARTNGEVYLGVVGAVRTGKSTFIKKFMDLLVIPNIKGEYRKERVHAARAPVYKGPGDEPCLQDRGRPPVHHLFIEPRQSHAAPRDGGARQALRLHAGVAHRKPRGLRRGELQRKAYDQFHPHHKGKLPRKGVLHPARQNGS